MTRYTQVSLQLACLTPTFLGNADQSAQWRTPPIKALLREWWRIAAAAGHGFDHRALLQKEGKLFGNATLKNAAGKNDHSRSQVLMKLESWAEGSLRNWAEGLPGRKSEPSVSHPNVKKRKGQVGAHLYLGYGPLKNSENTNRTILSRGSVISPEQGRNTLKLAWPQENDKCLRHALQLIHWFGTIGSRSRNGWGSLQLKADPAFGEFAALTADHPLLTAVLRPLEDCLSAQRFDWAHAIGKDAVGPLIWHSRESFPDWSAAMEFLAKTKIEFRTQLPFTEGESSKKAEPRHFLASPVTHHNVAAWAKKTGRFANQLRFKVFRDAAGALRVRIFHTPHSCPLGTVPDKERQAWNAVHRWLDNAANSQLQRLGA